MGEISITGSKGAQKPSRRLTDDISIWEVEKVF